MNFIMNLPWLPVFRSRIISTMKKILSLLIPNKYPLLYKSKLPSAFIFCFPSVSFLFFLCHFNFSLFSDQNWSRWNFQNESDLPLFPISGAKRKVNVPVCYIVTYNNYEVRERSEGSDLSLCSQSSLILLTIYCDRLNRQVGLSVVYRSRWRRKLSTLETEAAIFW